MVKVAIGIQARSTSSRLPKKSLEQIERLNMTEHVLSAACESAKFVSYSTPDSFKINVSVNLLVPNGDMLAKREYDDMVNVFEGDENDVLSRYGLIKDNDYIVRITGDCPLIPSTIITKFIKTATVYEYDYVSNTYPELRTFVDGYDCEVMSRKALRWSLDYADSDYHREHVTTFLKENAPSWCKMAAIMSRIDLSEIKLSVDTKQDLEKVRDKHKLLKNKLSAARKFGYEIYRF